MENTSLAELIKLCNISTRPIILQRLQNYNLGPGAHSFILSINF